MPAILITGGHSGSATEGAMKIRGPAEAPASAC
jgi:hypothetical protein